MAGFDRRGGGIEVSYDAPTRQQQTIYQNDSDGALLVQVGYSPFIDDGVPTDALRLRIKTGPDSGSVAAVNDQDESNTDTAELQTNHTANVSAIVPPGHYYEIYAYSPTSGGVFQEDWIERVITA